MQHHIDFTLKAPYQTLNTLNPNTKYIWIVCHGYGQLAEHFIKRFDVLDPIENFIIAPQGLSKFYLPENYRKVGASWMTKNDRETDMLNQRSYFNAIIEHELKGQDHESCQYVLMGFSQGVSMVSRFAAFAKINFRHLILWAGGFPPELTPENFEHISSHAELHVVLGTSDQYFNEENYKQEITKMHDAIGLEPNIQLFDGRHEVKREVLKSLIQ